MEGLIKTNSRLDIVIECLVCLGYKQTEKRVYYNVLRIEQTRVN
jgi:hypothetical protein